MTRPLRTAGIVALALTVAIAGVVVVSKLVLDRPPPVVFVHGLGGDASAIGRTEGAFGTFLEGLAARFPRDDVCQRDAEPNRPWEGSPCVFRYVDDVSTGGTSESGVEENARKLAAEVAEVSANADGDPVVLVGYSMGGLIVRAYLALYGSEASRHVASAVFIHGALSGSWLLASSSALSSAPGPLGQLLSTIRDVAEARTDDASSPAHRDLAPQSALIRRIARVPLPEDVSYVTVWGDIRLAVDTPGAGRVTVGSVGDVLLMPGSPTPSLTPALGGQRLRPTPSSIEIRHGGAVDVGIEEGAGLVAACAIPTGPSCREGLAPLLEHPSSHARIPETLDEIEVDHPVLGRGTIEELIVESISRGA